MSSLACQPALGHDLPMVEEGEPDPESETILNVVDPNRNRLITLQEYKALQEDAAFLISEQTENAFQAIDSDTDTEDVPLTDQQRKDLLQHYRQYHQDDMTTDDEIDTSVLQNWLAEQRAEQAERFEEARLRTVYVTTTTPSVSEAAPMPTPHYLEDLINKGMLEIYDLAADDPTDPLDPSILQDWLAEQMPTPHYLEDLIIKGMLEVYDLTADDPTDPLDPSILQDWLAEQRAK